MSWSRSAWVLGLVAAVVTLVGARGVAGATPAGSTGLEFVSWEKALERAGKENLIIFAHFSASWCKPCEELKRDVYVQPKVAKRLANFALAEIATESETDKALWMQLKEDGLPILAFYDSHGRELKDTRIKGLKTADELVELLDDVLERQASQRSPEDERAAAKGLTTERSQRPKVRGGDWQTTDTSWLGTAVLVMLGVMAGLIALFVVLKVRRERKLRA